MPFFYAGISKSIKYFQEKNTALHWAAYSGSLDVAEMFLKNSCDQEVANEHGDRPL